jgi:hypothetical protein
MEKLPVDNRRWPREPAGQKLPSCEVSIYVAAHNVRSAELSAQVRSKNRPTLS